MLVVMIGQWAKPAWSMTDACDPAEKTLLVECEKNVVEALEVIEEVRGFAKGEFKSALDQTTISLHIYWARIKLMQDEDKSVFNVHLANQTAPRAFNSLNQILEIVNRIKDSPIYREYIKTKRDFAKWFHELQDLTGMMPT